MCEEAFERRGFQENAEVCDGGYHDGHYAPFGNFDGYPEHFNKSNFVHAFTTTLLPTAFAHIAIC